MSNQTQINSLKQEMEREYKNAQEVGSSFIETNRLF
jgi:hypothetical protein